MSTSLERRVERLEVERYGAGRLFVVEVDADAADRTALVHAALHDAGEVVSGDDVLVVIKRFGAPTGLARLLAVQRKGGR